ncbi:methyltransferase [Fundidesulfovibrio terrae]|uniref:methyltransferase n=1 Tax=Fundidesulfovibrio terrae TaxID=2922866 RepID=UPI001FB0369E
MNRQVRIREAFGKAHAYDAHAAPQAATAVRLAELIAERGWSEGARVLDMGCGTGALAAALFSRARPGLYLCADISPPMLARARTKLATASPAPLFAAMDASLPALKPRFHLAASNMALHWTPDMAAALAGLWELLLPGGVLAVAVPGEGTFRAWREAHERRGLSCGLQDFPSASALAGLFPATPHITEEHHPLTLSHALDLPRHLKRVGGFVPRSGHVPLAPADFRAVLNDLDTRRPAMGYHVLYALAFKAPQE